ncbi:MAG TPA: NADH-quinone oxidoreductase subunit H [Polyangia bacterium]|nr:NADH-quinone oxidoreductase subunit H [Polyangia bacterium]
MPTTTQIVALALGKLIFLVGIVVMLLTSVLTWAERRQSAMMQDRLGPNRANLGRFRFWGLTHFLADALKMLFKEDVVPARAHKPLYTLAPVLALAPVLIVFAIIPFGDFLCLHDLGARGISDAAQCSQGSTYLQVAHMDIGILFYFAIASLSVYGAVLAGWSSYNKFGLLGGLRASSQMMAYEVTLGMSLLGLFLVYGTIEPHTLVKAQGPTLWHWGIVTQPLGFLLFLTSALAETKRTPFDQVEGEPEIIGHFVEYSGLRFGMFYLGEFIEVVFTAAVLTTCFFGGWYLPFWDATQSSLPHWLVVLIQFGTWFGKVAFFCWLQLMIRWSLPRFRPDQLLQLGWLRLLPASILNVVGTAGVLLFVR